MKIISAFILLKTKQGYTARKMKKKKNINGCNIDKLKAKATHHEGAWVERSIAPTQSRPRYYMGVSDQRYASGRALAPE
jgi:hypothetical protein